ncbi:unnamed protein product, partial [Phaeothamnion confervicola]
MVVRRLATASLNGRRFIPSEQSLLERFVGQRIAKIALLGAPVVRKVRSRREEGRHIQASSLFASAACEEEEQRGESHDATAAQMGHEDDKNPWGWFGSLLLFFFAAIFSMAAMVKGVFMIPAFFVFLRLGVFSSVTVSELQRAAQDDSSSLLTLGVVFGTYIVVTVSAVAIALVRVLHSHAVSQSESAEAIFDASWYLLSSVVLTYLAVSVIRLVALRDALRPHAVSAVASVDTEANGQLRSRRNGLFYAAMICVLRDG